MNYRLFYPKIPLNDFKELLFFNFRTTFIITADFIMRMTATWAVRFMADDGIQGITKWRQMAHGTNSQ